MKVEKNQFYRHYKGNKYYVFGIGRHTESEEEVVVYWNVDIPDKIWIRPKEMFEEKVNINGKLIDRFTKVD